jgi:hypothetical protein
LAEVILIRDLIRNFELRSKIGCISEIQRKTSFPLVFHSICTIFAGEIINTISSNEKTAVDDADSHCSNVRRNDVADIVPD